MAFQEAVMGDGYDQAEDVLGSGYHLAHQADREAGRGPQASRTVRASP